MDAKTKAKVQGILIGSGLVAFLIFFDKTYGPNAIAELAGSYEVFVWLFFWLVAAGSAVPFDAIQITGGKHSSSRSFEVWGMKLE